MDSLEEVGKDKLQQKNVTLNSFVYLLVTNTVSVSNNQR